MRLVAATSATARTSITLRYHPRVGVGDGARESLALPRNDALVHASALSAEALRGRSPTPARLRGAAQRELDGCQADGRVAGWSGWTSRSCDHLGRPMSSVVAAVLRSLRRSFRGPARPEQVQRPMMDSSPRSISPPRPSSGSPPTATSWAPVRHAALGPRGACSRGVTGFPCACPGPPHGVVAAGGEDARRLG